MGLLNVFQKTKPRLLQLPSGSFTVDREGTVLTRTVSSTFPHEIVEQIGELVLESFREANAAQVPLSQLEVTYPNFKITARELRGGAMVFLSAKSI